MRVAGVDQSSCRQGHGRERHTPGPRSAREWSDQVRMRGAVRCFSRNLVQPSSCWREARLSKYVGYDVRMYVGSGRVRRERNAAR
jgi:hypothetical protein